MAECPICRNEAGTGRTGEGGDFSQFACPRCGNYQITRTALAMLPSKLEANEPKNRARLCHAIRAVAEMEPTKNFVQIDSLNLFELINKPLPSIDRQVINLLRWAAKQLEDDQLGTIDLPDSEHLAGIIGTLDGMRVDELLRLADRDGLIDLPYDNCMTVSREGWEKLEPAKEPVAIRPVKTPTMETAIEVPIVKAPCNTCNGVKSCFVRATHTVDDSDGEVSWSNTFKILECRGCGGCVVQHEHWFSEWETIEVDSDGTMYKLDGVKTTYWPPLVERKKPKWSSELSDPVMRSIFNEIYTALASDLVVLATIGARTLFDRASHLQVGDVVGGFLGKLNAMVDDKLVGVGEKEILEAMTDAGNAAAHRGYAPTAKQLNSIMDILENYVHRSFILGETAKVLKQTTPPRPKPERPKKTK